MRCAAERLRRTAATALLVSVVAAPAADAATKARVCATTAVVLDSPGGFTVGYLFRGDRVTISRRSANRRWARVTTPTDLRGWIRARSLCRR